LDVIEAELDPVVPAEVELDTPSMRSSCYRPLTERAA